jgi:hypothetical protein
MAAMREIEAARKRHLKATIGELLTTIYKRPDGVFAEFEHLLIAEGMHAADCLILADAFCEQQSQPVNERLLNAAKRYRSLSRSADFDVQDELSNSITAAEAEIAERERPVTEEWLQSVGFKATFLPASEDSQLALLVFDDREIWPDGDVLLVYSNDGSYGFWERPVEEYGEWIAFHNNFKKLKKRGDVLELLRILGGAT